ncbi:helix-turn-helix transcriptional regulator [Streptomyces sp. NPDC051976]|uniref:helix-turn-helix transcriptional regulator n=1 Tax=Streptomyces sp. NPDC051976 TaxID=3154947 RepID=UPI00341D03C3
MAARGGRDVEAALAVYTVVAEGGRLGVAEVGLAAGLDGGRGEAGLRTLRELGLVRVVGGRVEAVDPDAALAAAMDTYLSDAAAHLESAREWRDTTQALLTVFRPAAAGLREHVVVEEYEDPESRAGALADLEATTRDTSDALHPGAMPEDMGVLVRALEMDAVLVRRGVRLRALYRQALLQVPRYNKYLHDLSDAGVDVRVIDHGAHDLLVYDRHTVVLPGVPSRRATSMTLVRGAVLVRSYAALFEDYWLRGKPLDVAGAGVRSGELELSDQERAIIRLMALGLSDDRIARTLGIARRTVQRVMSKLMERLQVSTRFEVGIRLARSIDMTDL